MAKVCWLHLSDFHTKSGSMNWRAEIVRQKLKDDIVEIKSELGQDFDFLFFTGDLAFGETATGELASQLDEGAVFLKEIAERSGIRESNIFVVPGNHDVNRSAVEEATTDLLEAWAKQGEVEKVVRLITDGKLSWKTVLKRLEEFRECLRGHFPHLLGEGDPERLCHAIKRHHAIGIDIGIACLNTAWSSHLKSSEERGRLWAGFEYQFSVAQKNLSGCGLLIALGHHPHGWFTEPDGKYLDENGLSRFHFFLHGHEHNNWLSNPSSTPTRIAGGAGYSESLCSYNAVVLDLDTGQGRAYLRQYSKEGPGGWIEHNIPEKTKGGIWIFGPLDLPTVKPVPAAAPASTTPVSTEEPSQPSALATGEDTPESRGVYGRRNDLARVVSALESDKVVVVFGMAGVGKSVLLREVERNDTCGATWLKYSTSKGMTFDNLLLRLCKRFQVKRDGTEPQEAVIGGLGQKMSEAGPLVFYMDNIEHIRKDRAFTEAGFAKFFRYLTTLGPGVRCLLESREDAPNLNLSPNTYTPVHLSGLDKDALVQYFKNPNPDEPRMTWTIDPQDVNVIFDKLGGEKHKALPFCMNLLAVVAWALKLHPIEVLKDQPDEYDEKISDFLIDKLYQNIGEHARHALNYCAIYREDIPSWHISDLNKLAGCTTAFGDLQNRCLLVQDNRKEWYTLHLLIKDSVRDKLRKTPGQWKNLHGALARVWIENTGALSSGSDFTIYVANEAAFHSLTAAGRSPEKGEFLDRIDLMPILREESSSAHAREDHQTNFTLLRIQNLLEPDDSEILFYLAMAWEREGEKGVGMALNLVKRAHALAPANPRYLSKLTSCLDKAGRSQEAAALRQAEIAGGSLNPAIYNDEAKALMDQGEYDQALAVLDQARALGIENDYLRETRAAIERRRPKQ